MSNEWGFFISVDWWIMKEKSWLVNALFCRKPFWHNRNTVIYTIVIMKNLTINIIHKVIGGILPFIIERHIFDLSIYHRIVCVYSHSSIEKYFSSLIFLFIELVSREYLVPLNDMLCILFFIINNFIKHIISWEYILKNIFRMII